MKQGGFSAVAAYLSAATGRNITRQQVYLWNKRRTINAAGQPFPSPLYEDTRAKRRQPRLIFSIDAALAWLQAGDSPLQASARNNPWNRKGIDLYTPVLC